MSSPHIERSRTEPAMPRLSRSRDDRMVAGVAGGLGRHLGVDPVILRIVFVVLALAGGGGLLAYLLAWLVIPEEAGDGAPAASGADASLLAGLVLVGLGVLLLADRFLPVFSWRYLGPVVLIALGGLLLARRKDPR
jgi:phage shock protein C